MSTGAEHLDGRVVVRSVANLNALAHPAVESGCNEVEFVEPDAGAAYSCRFLGQQQWPQITFINEPQRLCAFEPATQRRLAVNALVGSLEVVVIHPGAEPLNKAVDAECWDAAPEEPTRGVTRSPCVVRKFGEQ
jgi:hypothetical protein